MRTLYLDCGMGAAGDMLAAALLELLPDREGFIERLNGLGIPGVRYELEKSVKCGILGSHLKVTVEGQEEVSSDSHENDHEHQHHHHLEDEHDHHHDHEHHHHAHTTLNDIYTTIQSLDLPHDVSEDVMLVYSAIADAESLAHGVTVEQVHFHEVGAMDAFADITAVSMLVNELKPDEIIVSPINTGFGKVHAAHGILPVPAPATAAILRGLPIYSGRFEGELCTPTGAALLRHFATEFGAMPVMTVEKIGYGMGKKDFKAVNCVRAMIGYTDRSAESIVELQCNIDDMTAEEIGFAFDMIFDAGALEVFTTPCGMKKNRPGTLLTVLCRSNNREPVINAVFKYTETLGIRELERRRYTLNRHFENVEIDDNNSVRVKVSEGYGVMRKKPEYDDLVKLARNRKISLREARKLLDHYEVFD